MVNKQTTLNRKANGLCANCDCCPHERTRTEGLCQATTQNS